MKSTTNARGDLGTRAAPALSLIAIGMLWATAHASVSANVNRMGPYLIANRQQEIALARSAAPPSISMLATVMVLGPRGYVIAAHGSNGFVCLVVRSWDNTTSARRSLFWNANFRAPMCYNAPGAQSVLRRYLMRTQWVAAGANRAQISARAESAWASGRLEAPLPGAMCYMMSRRGRWIGGHPGPWRPHLMLFFPRGQAPVWGANLAGVPVLTTTEEDITILYVLVPEWSGGRPAPLYK